MYGSSAWYVRPSRKQQHYLHTNNINTDLGGTGASTQNMMRNGALSHGGTTSSSCGGGGGGGGGMKLIARGRAMLGMSSTPSVKMTAAISLIALLLAYVLLSASSAVGRMRYAACDPYGMHRYEDALAGERFTVVLNTFRRPERLKKAIAHYATCGPIVARIRVPWSEVGVPMPTKHTHEDLFSACVDVGFLGPHNTTSINNRFLPIDDVPKNSAVFSVDDDVLVSCESLAFAFEVRTYIHTHTRAGVE